MTLEDLLPQPRPEGLGLLQAPPRFLFFTGKGGVGKTSLSCAVALQLAEAGHRVLLVSTDPASNLDEMLGVALSAQPQAVPGAPGLDALNIDPEAAAEAYRARVLAQIPPEQAADRATVREQLSGACTTEIAAFDEFVGLLAGQAHGFDPAVYAHIVFDTAPTGHTLRLLSLPQAWTGFLAGNDRGASCLGPHSGLKMQEARFREGLAALADPARTAIVLVARADTAALREAARSHEELAALGLTQQRLLLNAVLPAASAGAPMDVVSATLRTQQQAAWAQRPAVLAALPTDAVALKPHDMVGLAALRALLGTDGPLTSSHGVTAPSAGPDASPSGAALAPLPPLAELIDGIEAQGRGLILVMGKGGVGKTTVAAAIALALAERGHSVHLSTTDPAAHLSQTLTASVAGVQLDRIDPKAETARYIERVMATRGAGLSDAERALLHEDLQSPCTEEVAVFHAFSRTVSQARSAFVVLDTAPTGHTLLLMDATGAYHRQMAQELGGGGRFVTPLMRLQDSATTRVLLVTLPETTPVSEAAALQQDLRRAGIEPHAWIINRCLPVEAEADPLLRARRAGEQQQIARVRSGLAQRCHALPWQAEPPVGPDALRRLLGHAAGG